MADLALKSRKGLSDELAYLRTAYPKEGWRDHSNFGELTRFWLHIHDSLRHHGGMLERTTAEFREGRLDAGQFQRSFVPGLNQFLQHLMAHHQIEDRQYFPKFRLLDERMVAGFDLLEIDHHRIHEALVASAGAANEFLQAMGKDRDALLQAGDRYSQASSDLLGLLLRHLADEEDLVVPAMLHHGERSVD